jgi:hypothetical protein
MPADAEVPRAESGSLTGQEEGHLEQAEKPLQNTGESNFSSFQVPYFYKPEGHGFESR